MITSQTSKVQYNLSGTDSIAVSLVTTATSPGVPDITAIYTTSAGVANTLVINTHFTISSYTSTGFTFNWAGIYAPPNDPTSGTLTILRNTPYTQETDYVENDPFLAETHEAALDKLTVLAQNLKEFADRSLKAPPNISTSFATDIENWDGGKYLRIAADELSIEAVAADSASLYDDTNPLPLSIGGTGASLSSGSDYFIYADSGTSKPALLAANATHGLQWAITGTTTLTHTISFRDDMVSVNHADEFQLPGSNAYLNANNYTIGISNNGDSGMNLDVPTIIYRGEVGGGSDLDHQWVPIAVQMSSINGLSGNEIAQYQNASKKFVMQSPDNIVRDLTSLWVPTGDGGFTDDGTIFIDATSYTPDHLSIYINTTAHLVPTIAEVPAGNAPVFWNNSSQAFQCTLTPDFGGLTSLEIPNGTGPTVDAAGEIAIDTNTDNSNITHGSLIFHDGTSVRYNVSIGTLPSTDGHVLTYNGTNKRFEFAAIPGGVSAATQSDQETATSTSAYVSPGRQHFHPSAAKVWVMVNTSGTIQASYNVTSVTDTGTGISDVTIATDLSSGALCCAVSPISDTCNIMQIAVTNFAAGTFRILGFNNSAAAADPSGGAFSAVIYGDLP